MKKVDYDWVESELAKLRAIVDEEDWQRELAEFLQIQRAVESVMWEEICARNNTRLVAEYNKWDQPLVRIREYYDGFGGVPNIKQAEEGVRGLQKLWENMKNDLVDEVESKPSPKQLLAGQVREARELLAKGYDHTSFDAFCLTTKTYVEDIFGAESSHTQRLDQAQKILKASILTNKDYQRSRGESLENQRALLTALIAVVPSHEPSDNPASAVSQEDDVEKNVEWLVLWVTQFDVQRWFSAHVA